MLTAAPLTLEVPDCLDIAFALGDIQLAAKLLKARFIEAAEDELDPQEVVRERLAELRQLRVAITALLANTEPA